MFHAIRTRINATTVLAGLALVFAMTGGAYAAKKYLITSTKQISPSVLKALQGKAGAAGGAGTNGAQGPAGPAGAQGPAGAAGAKGEAGAAGKTGATGGAGATGATGPKGATGANGLTGFTETLPSKKTETGSWAVIGVAYGGPEIAVASVSFTIPLASDIAAENVHYIAEGLFSSSGTGDIESGSSKILNAKAAPNKFEAEQEISGEGIPAGTLIVKVVGKELTLTKAATVTKTGVALTVGPPPVPAGCTGGTAAEPKAEPGNLCIYSALGSRGGAERAIFKSGTGEPGASRNGVYLLLTPLGSTSVAHGTWAVTAP